MNSDNLYLIYFFATDFNRVKIGHCRGNLHNRRKHIQNGCPDPIKLLGIINCKDKNEMRQKETEIHKRFHKYQRINEWFELTPEIQSFIAEFTEKGEDILQDHYKLFRKKSIQYNRKYRNRPEARERRRQTRTLYRQRPEVIAREREYHREYKRKKRINAKKKISPEQLSLFNNLEVK